MLRTSGFASVTTVMVEVTLPISNMEKEFHFYFSLSCILLRHHEHIEVQVLRG